MKSSRSCSRAPASQSGFTRLDLTALITMTALLLAVALPVVATNKSITDQTECLANNRQLIQSWLAFSLDHNESMPGALEYAQSSSAKPFQGTGADTTLAQYQPWCTGVMTWDSNSQNTNTILLSDPNYSVLAPYLKRNKDVFKCPADVFLSSVQKSIRFPARARSVSTSVYVGNGAAGPATGPWNTSLTKVRKTTDFNKPSPGNVFIFLEEHPDSINDGGFYAPFGSPGALTVVDLPANYHDGGATLSFGDGHAQLKRWNTLPMRTLPMTGTFSAPSGAAVQSDLSYLFAACPQLF